MTILTTPRPRTSTAPVASRRPRFDAEDLSTRSNDAVVLRRWIAYQSTRYEDLLATIAAAPTPQRKRSA